MGTAVELRVVVSSNDDRPADEVKARLQTAVENALGVLFAHGAWYVERAGGTPQAAGGTPQDTPPIPVG